jgi:hypothetical protein
MKSSRISAIYNSIIGWELKIECMGEGEEGRGVRGNVYKDGDSNLDCMETFCYATYNSKIMVVFLQDFYEQRVAAVLERDDVWRPRID